jgi:hypothetical protein
MVALTLTGAPALAARPEAGEHHCQCRAHARDHECECARCHEATRKQREAAEAAVPPCHRAAAKEAKEKDEPPPRPLAGLPCITGTCGGPDAGVVVLTPLDVFTLPLALAPAGAPAPSGSVHGPPGAQRDAPSLPETPPPRAGEAPAARA